MHPATPTGSAPGVRATGEAGAAVHDEAQLLARYLLGETTTPEVAERYRAALVKVAGGSSDRGREGVADFAFAHPWSLPYLDAATSLLAPHGELRRRLLVMLAVLEATPEHVEHFRVAARPRRVVVGRLVAWGLASGWKLLIGLALYPFAARAR